MKRKGLSKKLVHICLALVLALTLSMVSANTAVAKQPKEISVVFGATATSGYQSGVGLAASIEEATGTKIRFSPVAKTMGRTIAIKRGQADFAWYTAADCIFAMEGIYDFKPAAWGPQSVRTVWVCGSFPLGVATQGDSGIKTWADAKGKKIATYPTHISGQFFIDAAMAYGNVKHDEVILTPQSGWGSAQQSIIDGSCNIALMSGQSAQAHQAAASIHKLHWVPMPNKTAEDKAGWERFWKLCPALFPSNESEIAGASPENPADIMVYNYHVVSYDWQDADLAYWFTKQLAEKYDVYKDKHAYLKRFTLEHCLDYTMWYVPWHPGSIRYFKDAGVWTPEMEAKNRANLAKYPHTMTK